MITIAIILFLVVSIPLLFVMLWLKFLDYLGKSHPTWIGEGLRARLSLFLRMRKPCASHSDYPNNNVPPSYVGRDNKYGFYKIQQRIVNRVRAFSRFNKSIHIEDAIKNPRNENYSSNNEDKSEQLKPEQPIHSVESSTPEKPT